MKMILVFFLMASQIVHANQLENFFNNLITSGSKKTKDSQSVLNAQLSPYLSSLIQSDETKCDQGLSTKDLEQLSNDQYLIRSLYEINKRTDFTKGSEVNKYFSIVTQKLAIVASRSADDSKFINNLSQEDLMVMKFIAQTEGVLKLNSLIRAHQSIELGDYTIDGYLKLAVNEFTECSKNPAKCKSKTDQLWSSWFSKDGFGLYDPNDSDALNTRDGKSLSKISKREDLNIKVDEDDFFSKELTKRLFDAFNIYGEKEFDYFNSLRDEKIIVKNEAKNIFLAPGKVIAGVMLKLAAQRTVAYYKYQKCRLLKQNSGQMTTLEQMYNQSVNNLNSNATTPSNSSNAISNSPNGQPQSTIGYVGCEGNQCPPGSTQVTSGNGTVAITEQTGSRMAQGLHCGNDKNIWDGTVLKEVCPKAPNGGIACENKPEPKCAGEGNVWINGKIVKWQGNRLNGSCYASSACDFGYSCNSSSRTCTPKEETKEEEGTKYKRSFNPSKNEFSVWSFEGCSGGYATIDNPNKCSLTTKECSVDNGNGVGRQRYDTKTKRWGECGEVHCVAPNYGIGLAYLDGKCISTTRKCKVTIVEDLFPSKYPRAQLKGVQYWGQRMVEGKVEGGWGECNPTNECEEGFIYTTSNLENETSGSKSVTGPYGYCKSYEQNIELSTSTFVQQANNVPVLMVSVGVKNYTACEIKVVSSNGKTYGGTYSVANNGSLTTTYTLNDLNLANTGGNVTAECWGGNSHVRKMASQSYSPAAGKSQASDGLATTIVKAGNDPSSCNPTWVRDQSKPCSVQLASQFGFSHELIRGQASFEKNTCNGNLRYVGGCEAANSNSSGQSSQNNNSNCGYKVVSNQNLSCSSYAGKYGVPETHIYGTITNYKVDECKSESDPSKYQYTGGCSATNSNSQSGANSQACNPNWVPDQSRQCSVQLASHFGFSHDLKYGTAQIEKNTCNGNQRYVGGCVATPDNNGSSTQSCTPNWVSADSKPCSTQLAIQFGFGHELTSGQATFEKNTCNGNLRYVGGCVAPSSNSNGGTTPGNNANCGYKVVNNQNLSCASYAGKFGVPETHIFGTITSYKMDACKEESDPTKYQYQGGCSECGYKKVSGVSLKCSDYRGKYGVSEDAIGTITEYEEQTCLAASDPNKYRNPKGCMNP